MPDTTQIPVACFAPPFSDELLKKYTKLVRGIVDPQLSELKDCLTTLLTCISQWWELPESKTKRPKEWEFKTKDGKSVVAVEQPLDDEQKQVLWNALPYMRELLAMEPLLDSISPRERELRDCAFHLLWACKELTLDREPMTVERLK